MKNKTVAGLLAFIGGYVGIHHFYLGRVGRGIAYIFLLPIFMMIGLWAIPFIIGFVDGAKLWSMSQEEFDKKYNGGSRAYQDYQNRGKTRYERRQDRNQSRRERHQRPPMPRQKERLNKTKSEKALKQGIERFKDFDFDEALVAFNQALEADPKNAAVHFNLACTYSLTENKDKGFYHLDRAVALGLDDFEILKTRDHLAYLRVQEEWEQFAANGFRLAQQIKAPKPANDELLSSEPVPNTSAQTDLLQQLQQLAKLKEKGLLTEEEFKVQKEKLLR